MYADFDPLARNSPDDRQYSYRIPGYQLVGASVSWAYEWKYGARPTRKIGLNVFMRGDNSLNTTYMERGKDGTTHDLASFAAVVASAECFHWVSVSEYSNSFHVCTIVDYPILQLLP